MFPVVLEWLFSGGGRNPCQGFKRAGGSPETAALAAAAAAARPTCWLVRPVRTISSSGITCAGLKKCAPTMRSCARVLAPTTSMSMVLVLVDRMQSGLQGGVVCGVWCVGCVGVWRVACGGGDGGGRVVCVPVAVAGAWARCCTGDKLGRLPWGCRAAHSAASTALSRCVGGAER